MNYVSPPKNEFRRREFLFLEDFIYIITLREYSILSIYMGIFWFRRGVGRLEHTGERAPYAAQKIK